MTDLTPKQERALDTLYAAAEERALSWQERHAALMQRVEANVVSKPRPAERTLAGAAGIIKSRHNLRNGR